MSINIEYNIKEANFIVVKHVLKMLEDRKLIDSADAELKKLSNDLSNNKTTFEIELNNKLSCGIYLINAKMTSIVQGTPLDDYLSNNIDIHKIIVAKDVAKKVVKQIVNDYNNAEFFFENEMMEYLPSKIFIPEHIIMNKDEKEELLNKFTESELARIYSTDRMARYYGAKVGDIIKIIRPSSTAGKNVFYRRVINGSWNNLFE